MMLISRLKRKKKKKGPQEDPKCLSSSLKMELDARNKELETLKEEQTKELNIKNEEAAVLRAKIEDLTSRNADSLVQLEEMRKKCSDFEEQLNKNNKKKEMHLTFSQTESAGMRPSTKTTIKGKSEEEILEMITQLQQTNKELHAAVAMEKKKSQRRRQEASERRAKFKQRVQNLTRKLSDDSSSEEDDDDDENDAILPAPTHSANNTPKQGGKNKLIGIEISV
jgi:uncharacterized protein YecA (UPF0149 family)